MIIRRIPMNALQQGVYSILTEKQEGDDVFPVYDDVPEGASLPYVTIGAFTCKQTDNKMADIKDISLQLHIWSEYNGKSEVNRIADDITGILTAWPIDLSSSGFEVINQDVDFFEAFPEETAGYHGVVTFVSTIQNLGV